MLELISVIIPIYNVEKYIERCLESIINQTYKNIEIILVDDGSTDNSSKICDDYEKKYSNISVIHKLNGGLSDARNAGMKIAKGEFICFFDSDDWFEIDILEKAYNNLYENRSDVVIWGFSKDFVDDNENVLSNMIYENGNVYCTKSNHNYRYLMNEKALSMIGYAWNKLYKRELLVKNNLTFLKGVSLVEDMLFNEQVFINANAFSFISNVGTHYIQRNRETLGSKYYSNYFDLKIRSCFARENVLREYGATKLDIELTLNNSFFYAVISSCRNITNNKIMNKKDKKNEIKRICLDKRVKKILKRKLYGVKSHIYKLIIISRQYNLLMEVLKK